VPLKQLAGGAAVGNDWRYYLVMLGNLDVIHLLKRAPELNVMLIGITWSVCIEEQFYAVWPWVFRLLSVRVFPWVAASIYLGSVAFRAVHARDSTVVYYHTFSVVSDLALGGICAYHTKHSPQLLAAVRGFSRRTLLVGYVVGAATMLLGDHLGPVFGRVATTTFFAFVIVEQCFCTGT
jgi:peptidoglycan/LPS O-acetylase OafA/YrhL